MEEKQKKKDKKNIKIWVDKLNRLDAIGSGIVARSNTFGLVLFWYFL